MISPNGALGIRTMPAAQITERGEEYVELLRVSEAAVKGMSHPENVAEGI